eukprot:833327_1
MTRFTILLSYICLFFTVSHAYCYKEEDCSGEEFCDPFRHLCGIAGAHSSGLMNLDRNNEIGGGAVSNLFLNALVSAVTSLCVIAFCFTAYYAMKSLEYRENNHAMMHTGLIDLFLLTVTVQFEQIKIVFYHH